MLGIHVLNQIKKHTSGLAIGLWVFAITAATLLGLVGVSPNKFGIARGTPSQIVRQTAPAPDSVVTEAFLQKLQAFDVVAARRLYDDRRLYISPDQLPLRRQRTLQTAVQALADVAIYMPNVESAHYRRILNDFETGIDLLSANRSDWCAAPRIATLVRMNEEDVLPAAIAIFAADPAAYNWLLNWTTTILDAAITSREAPVFHGRRTARDKQIVQSTGRAFASEYWMLAVSIANFSFAEGQSYAAMEDAVQNIDVCEAGQAFVNLSRRIPSQVSDRVLAELLPALFSGRTDYALYLIRNYFFLD